MADLHFSTLRPADLFELKLQPSQGLTLGMETEAGMTMELAKAACAQRCAWAVRDGKRLIACFGIIETIPKRQGLGWCNLASGIGYGHLKLTRFIRGQAEACGLPRLELLALAPDLEHLLASRPHLDSGQVVALALAASTPQIRWAMLLGFKPAHVLRCYGAASESYMLCERIDPAARVPVTEREAA